MLSRFLRIRTIDKLIIALCVLVIASVASLGVIYIRKSPVPYAHRGSLNPPKPALQVHSSQVVSGDPAHISIPSLGVSLDVINGSQGENGLWTLTPDKAQYAVISPRPNNHEGNTVIYGHATQTIFGRLFSIKQGATADISTSNGYMFHYKYEGNYPVNPYDFSIFNYKGAPILTLQTCSGSFYQNRQMFQFSYVGYEKL